MSEWDHVVDDFIVSVLSATPNNGVEFFRDIQDVLFSSADHLDEDLRNPTVPEEVISAKSDILDKAENALWHKDDLATCHEALKEYWRK